MSKWSGPPKGWQPFAWAAIAISALLLVAYILVARSLALFHEPFDVEEVAISYVTEYDAFIADEDRLDAKGKPLIDQLAILQRDRENFHTRAIRQHGDTADRDTEGVSFFASARNRDEIGRGTFSVALPVDTPTQHQMTAAGTSLHVRVHRRDGRLVLSVSRLRTPAAKSNGDTMLRRTKLLPAIA